MVANFDGERLAISLRHIRRVAHDQFELFAGDGREQVAFEEADAVGDIIESSVLASEGKCVRRQIDCGDRRTRQMPGQRNGYAARAGADVNYP
jgi:hypothetical protein